MTRIIVLAACTMAAAFIGYLIFADTGAYLFGAVTAVGLVAYGRKLSRQGTRQF